MANVSATEQINIPELERLRAETKHLPYKGETMADLVIGALNALPALLEIARASADVSALQDEEREHLTILERVQRLREALARFDFGEEK